MNSQQGWPAKRRRAFEAEPVAPSELRRNHHAMRCACRVCYDARREPPAIPIARVVVIRQRRVRVDGTEFTAFNAHDLLDSTSEIGRPGHEF